MTTPAAPSRAETLAGQLYTAYCAAVGGVAFNGDPLPDWATFAADLAKKKQADAWRIVAHSVLMIEDLARGGRPGADLAHRATFGTLHFPDEQSLRHALNGPRLLNAAWIFNEWLGSQITEKGKPWDEVLVTFFQHFGGLLND